MKTRIVPKDEDAVFHVVSRMAFQMLNLKEAEKRMFRDMLERQAAFSGVEVLSYCLLDNHFHILLRIPHLTEISDATLLKRYRALYADSESRFVMPPAELELLLKTGGKTAKATRTRLFARMGNISVFMKELKQRFGIWYNRKHSNSGTLWAKRFDSILVENVKKTLQLMGAYIDLNPVRLKLCKDAKDYEYCTYGEAFKGNATARKWLASSSRSKQWSHTLKQYQTALKENDETLQATMHSLKGMKTGVIGSKDFIGQWSRYKETKHNTKRSVPSLILGGVLYVGACALSARQDFSMSSSIA